MIRAPWSVIRRRMLATVALVAAMASPLRGAPPAGASPAVAPARPPSAADVTRQLRDQQETDRTWARASEGVMRMEKITYRSSVDGLQVPAFVFQPLVTRGRQQHPALVWVHENIRGHLYEHYIPYIRDAVARGYIVIAPEYRGSIGYGRAHYDAIDYGGAEVDDVTSAVGILRSRYADVDPTRIGIIGWSHGGMIALLAVTRSPTLFRTAVSIVPVTNLLHRLARKGVDAQLREIDPHHRFGGTPSEKPEVYLQRSPLFHIDQLRIPLLVHIAANDDDVTFDEASQLVDALRSRKPDLADVKVYRAPFGGHLFDRQVLRTSWQPINTPDQRDSWQRVWAFFERTLE